MHTTNEFDFLTQETVRISEAFGSMNDDDLDLETFSNFKLSNYLDEASFNKKDDQIYPHRPGLVYKIHQSGNTYSVKGFACESIEDAFDLLKAGDKSLLRVLKIDSDNIDNVHFYELNSFDRAEVVLEQIFNKRFPLEEDVLCNIGDPGFSWWYGKSVDGFRINFKSHKFMCAGERLKLGPIGDVVVAKIRFEKLKEHFKYHLPVSEMIVNEKQFLLKSSDATHPILKEIKQLFELGILDEDSALLCELDHSLKLYLLELSDIRKFWINIEHKLLDGKKYLLN